MGMPIAGHIKIEDHIAALEKRRETILHFCFEGMYNLLALIAASVMGMVNTSAIPDLLKRQAANQVNQSLKSFCQHLFEMLSFDVTQSINVLTKQLQDRPKQCIEDLARLIAQRDIYLEQMARFDETMKLVYQANPEIFQMLQPFLQLCVQQFSTLLTTVNQQISYLQNEMESGPDGDTEAQSQVAPESLDLKP